MININEINKLYGISRFVMLCRFKYDYEKWMLVVQCRTRLDISDEAGCQQFTVKLQEGLIPVYDTQKCYDLEACMNFQRQTWPLD